MRVERGWVSPPRPRLPTPADDRRRSGRARARPWKRRWKSASTSRNAARTRWNSVGRTASNHGTCRRNVSPPTSRNSMNAKYAAPSTSSVTPTHLRGRCLPLSRAMRTQNCTARMTSCDASSSEYGSVAECQLSNGGSHATGRQACNCLRADPEQEGRDQKRQQNAMNARGAAIGGWLVRKACIVESAERRDDQPPFSSPSSDSRSTDTTRSSSAVSNTITPWVARPAMRMPSTLVRINCPPLVTSMS